MTPIRYKLLKPWLQHHRRSSQRGFTLLELLIAMLIGGIIISSLMFLVLEMLKASQREEALSQTQQDMRRAIDYMTSDVGEAVFVYADPNTITAQLTDLPDEATPVLAFWRLDPIDVNDAPDNCAELSDAKEKECDALKVRQSIYTLVVYLQQENAADTVWEGQSRIIRYELPKYSNMGDLTQRTGYADPTLSLNDGSLNSFEDWARQSGSASTDGVVNVLTDYVDQSADAPTCPDNYATAATGTNASFFACVTDTSTGTSGETENSDQNKSVILYLTGNATDNRSGLVSGPFSEASRLPTLESEVLIRGVIGKTPDET